MTGSPPSKSEWTGGAFLGQPEVDSPSSERPVVMYGSSILQGGCANRPGWHTRTLLFVLDYVPNASAEAIDQAGEEFFRVLRNAHPLVSVVFVEDPIFPHSAFDNAILKEINEKNAAQKRLFLKLRKSGERRIYYVGAEGMIGDDGEATVDGIHFTDLGAVRYVEHILPVVRKALRKTE